MHIYDLTFTNGNRCRCIVMEPGEDDAEGIGSIFQGRLASAVRVIPPCPARLPWVKDGEAWRLHRFTLRKDGGGWLVEWPGGSARGSSAEVSQAVRDNWRLGC